MSSPAGQRNRNSSWSALKCFMRWPALRETPQTNDLPERDPQVHHTQPADGAAQVHVVPLFMPFGNQGGEIVAIPEFRPWKDHQKKTNLQAEGDQQDCRHLVIP